MNRTTASGAPLEVSTAEIVANPSKYYGKQVKLRADVSNVYSPHSFTLGKQKDDKPEILVLNPAPVRAPNEKDSVTATGKLRKYVQADITREYSWFANEKQIASPEFAALVQTMPVLVATSVNGPGGDDLVQHDTGSQRAGDSPETSGSRDQPNAGKGAQH